MAAATEDIHTMQTIAEPRIRGASAADLPRIEHLLTANDLPLAGVRDALPTFLVAETGDELVGVAGLEVCCDNALLRSVAVDQRYRSKGVGRALVTQLIGSAEARGLHALYLLTTTAEQYFPSFGFRPIERSEVPDDVRATEEFTSACPASARVMTRELARAS
jgi:amino-acid N-acetyltransferase